MPVHLPNKTHQYARKNDTINCFFGLFFPVFTLLALGLDSVYFTKKYFDARTITNLVTIGYFFLLYFYSSAYLKKLMLIMVVLSSVGEFLCCSLLQMYDYKSNSIPLYVPFGHAIVYTSGFALAQTKWAQNNDRILKKYFFIGFLLLFISVIIFLNDLLTLPFSILFFMILKRKNWQNLYYFIALCVLFIELTGTYFQCWQWKPYTFNCIPTINPPMGAVFIYAGGDVLLAKIGKLWNPKF